MSDSGASEFELTTVCLIETVTVCCLASCFRAKWLYFFQHARKRKVSNFFISLNFYTKMTWNEANTESEKRNSREMQKSKFEIGGLSCDFYRKIRSTCQYCTSVIHLFSGLDVDVNIIIAYCSLALVESGSAQLLVSESGAHCSMLMHHKSNSTFNFADQRLTRLRWTTPTITINAYIQTQTWKEKRKNIRFMPCTWKI